jgi:hypothetical protein
MMAVTNTDSRTMNLMQNFTMAALRFVVSRMKWDKTSLNGLLRLLIVRSLAFFTDRDFMGDLVPLKN